MENKTESVIREILKSIIDRYGNKPKNVLVKKVKEQGVYKNFVDDNEVYSLVQKFAEFHKLPFGYIEPILKEQPESVLNVNIVEHIDKQDEVDYFFESLKKEHSILSKKLLALNKLMETYKIK